MNNAIYAWMLIIQCCLPMILSGQNNWQVMGVVRDENGVTIPGAVVQWGRGNSSLLTGKDGEFSINAGNEQSIPVKISFLGFTSYEATIYKDLHGSGSTLNVILKPSVVHLHEVEISDQFAERRKKEDSRGMEIVGQEYLKENRSGSLMQTIDRLPGVGAVEIGAAQSKPVIRGLGFNRVVVSDHGIKHESQQWGADHGLEIDQFAVERVEVIKGPGSLAYGSDAIGGLLELSSGEIPEKHTFSGEATLAARSNNGYWGGSVFAQGRKERWFFKSRITFADYADYRVPVDSVTINSYRVPLKDHRLRNTAGSEFNAHLSVGIAEKRASSVTHFSNIHSRSGFFANAQGLSPVTADSSYDRSFRDIQLPWQWVNHFKVVNNTVFYTGKVKTELEAGYQNNLRREYTLYVGHGYMPPVFPETPCISSELSREYRKNTFSLNMKSSFPWKEYVRINAGVTAEGQLNRIGGWDFMIPSFDQWLVGGFILGQRPLGRNFTVQAGLRYDYGWVIISPYSDWFTTPEVSGGDTTWIYAQRASQLSRNFGSFSWSVGIVYSSGKTLVKINAGKSFRMPLPKELAVNGVNYHYFIYEKGNPDLDPEVSYQLDAGLEWRNDRMSISVSPFVNYFPNYIYLNPGYEHDYTNGAGNQIYNYVQAEVFRTGGEFQIHYHFSDRWMAGVAAEYIWSRQLSGEKQGYTLPFSPPLSTILQGKFTPACMHLLHQPFIAADITLTAPQNEIVPPELKTPGFIDISLSAGADLMLLKQPWKLTIQVNNLLNSVYFSHISYYRLMDIPQPGRNVAVNLYIPF